MLSLLITKMCAIQNGTALIFEYDLFSPMNADSILTSSLLFLSAELSFSFKFLASAVLAVSLLCWCLFLKWDGQDDSDKLTSLGIPRLLIIVVLYFWYKDYWNTCHSVSGIDRWSLFVSTEYSVCGKLILIVFVIVALFSKFLSGYLSKYALMLLLFGMLLLDTSHLLSLYVCLEALSLVSYGLLASGGTAGNA